MYSSAKFGRFKSNCMTEGKWHRGPTLLDRGDLCHSSVCGFTGFWAPWADALLSWLITTEPRQGAIQTEAETMRQSRGRGSKVETEARPCEAEPAKKTASSRGRCLEDYIPGYKFSKTIIKVKQTDIEAFYCKGGYKWTITKMKHCFFVFFIALVVQERSASAPQWRLCNIFLVLCQTIQQAKMGGPKI